MTRPYTRLSGNPIENCPFQASFKEVRRTGRIETPLAEGALFRDARGRLRTDLVRSILLWVDLDAFRELGMCLDFMDISSMKIDAASSKLF
ncbi:hypothetical protein EBS43_11455 [bacterium]|nr:hypothetical protein [bacterium]